MNTTKRLLSVLMCIAMLLSSLSSFGFALGNDTLAGATDAVETVVGDASTVGPNPTTNVAAPVIDRYTVVYDNTATEENAAEYDLSTKFVDKSGLTTFDYSDWEPIWGETLFNNYKNAVIAATTNANGSGTVLLINDILAGGTVATTGVKDVYIYTPYYNVMPYTIAGTAKDGSDWTVNQDFVDNAPEFTTGWHDFRCGVDFNIYGIAMTGGYFNTAGARSGNGVGLSANYTNVYYNGSSFIDNILFSQSGCESGQSNGQVGGGQDSDYIISGSSATFKNCWVRTTYNKQLFYEESPMTLTFDGVYWDEVQQTHGSKNWFKQGPHNTPTPTDEVATLNFVNCNFQNSYFKILMQGKASKNLATKRVLNIANNVFRDSSLATTPTGAGNYLTTSNGIIGEFYGSDFTHLNITNNIFVDTQSDATLLAGYGSNTYVVTMKNNILNGVAAQFNGSAANVTCAAGSVITNNFASPTYTEDLSTVIGTPITATGAAGVDAETNFDDYLDADMTVLMSSLSIDSIDANGTGSILFDKAGKSVTWLKTSGSAANLVITGKDGVTYTWHTAKDAAAVDASTITAEGTYYIKGTKGDYVIWYTVTVAVPENMFADVFVENNGITKAAIFVDADSKSTAAGSIYEGSWKGATYNFIKGVNVFDSVAGAADYAAATGIANPQFLVKKTSETHIKASIPAKYYTENYDINPVVKGATWSLNPNFVYGAGCASSNVFDGLAVVAGAPAGDYYFYGFSVDYDISNRTFNAANMYVINTYIKIGDSGVFSGPGGQAAGTIASSKEMNSKLEVKDAYITYANMSKQPRLLTTGSLPTELIIDGAFFDVPADAATGREFYPNNYSDRAVVAIKNSYFKNTRWGGSAVFEGDKAAMAAEHDRKFIIDNNVFDNAYLGGDAIIRAYAQCFSGFTFTNNVLKNMDKDIVIFNNVGSESANKAFDLVIENNKIYGGSGKVAKTNGRTLSEASSIAKNFYAATEDAVCGANVFADESLYATSFYVDEEMTTLSTALLLESVTENSDDELTSVVLDNDALLITLTTPEDTTVLDIVPQEGTKIEWYEEADLSDEEPFDITEEALTADDFGEGVYFYGKVSPEDDDSKYLVYRISVVAPSDNLFKDVYGEQGEDTVNIDKDKAIIITNDEALVNASNSQIVALTWKGIEYDFIKGKNAFTSYAAYVASEEFGKIDTPHILYKQAVDMVKTEYKLHLQAPAHVFTQNWDANPVKKGVALDGSDWAFNEGTEAGQWNPAYVVELASFGILNADVAAGEYWFYGFTTRYHLEDHAKAAVDTKFINTHFLSRNWSALGADGHSTGGNILLSFGNKGNTAAEGEEPANAYQKVELKNVYVSLANGDVHPGLLFPGVMHEETVLDSWFIDIPETNTTYKSSTSTSFVGAKGSLVIKDSLFKNMLYNQLAFVGDDVVAGDDKTITIENNIFINSQFRNNYNGAICYKPNAFTGLTIKDNYFYKENGIEYLSSTGAGDAIEGAPFKLVITGNYINKKDGAWNAIKDRNYTEDSVIEGNYALVGDNAYGSYTFIQGDAKDENDKNAIYMYTNWWYLDAAMTARSDELQPGYTFNDAAFATEMAYEVGMKESTVNLMDLIDSKGNFIKAYADETCETPIDVKKVNVPAGGTKVYLKVESADGVLVGLRASTATAASEVDENVYAVSLTRTAGNYLNNIAGGSRLDTPNFTDRYWVTWRGEYTVTGAGAEAIDASKHRVGAIYYSDIVVEDTELGTTNLDAIKAAITAAVTADGATVASIDTVVTEINASRNSTIDRVYVLADTESLTWNNETQTYGFYYNFNIPQNYYRGVILYSVYTDDAGAVQVEFSNAVIQQAK